MLLGPPVRMVAVMLCAAIARTTAAAAVPWKVLPDTDWDRNIPGGNSCAVKGVTAADCGDACLALKNCVSGRVYGRPL